MNQWGPPTEAVTPRAWDTVWGRPMSRARAGLLRHVDNKGKRASVSCDLVSLHGGNILMQPLYEKMPSQGEKFRDAPQ